MAQAQKEKLESTPDSPDFLQIISETLVWLINVAGTSETRANLKKRESVDKILSHSLHRSRTRQKYSLVAAREVPRWNFKNHIFFEKNFFFDFFEKNFKIEIELQKRCFVA